MEADGATKRLRTALECHRDIAKVYDEDEGEFNDASGEL